MLKFYELAPSPNNTKVRMALRFKGVDFDALPVVDGKGVYIGAIRHKDLRRIDTRSPGPVAASSPFSIVLDLSELYWLGLSDVLRGLSATTTVEGEWK